MPTDTTTNTPAAQDSHHLIAEARARSGDDPIFALNAEARKRAAAGEHVVNATLGALLEDDGSLAVMPVVFEALDAVPKAAAAAYAPIAGAPAFLAAVVEDTFGTGPLAAACTAVATPGGTGALHHAVVNYLQPGQALLTPEFYWGPYKTLADHTRRRVETHAMFDADGRFDTGALAEGLSRQLERQGRALYLLNSPCNNPTGYSLDAVEWDAVAAVLAEAAARGPVTLVVDLAYARFGRGAGAGAHRDWAVHVAPIVEQVQVLVAWSGSKAYAQYGARIGALLAVVPDADERRRAFDALSYSCRGTWSNCNHLGMLAVTALLTDPALRERADAEREHLRGLLAERVDAFNLPAGAARLAYPRYEGGFFVTVGCADPKGVAAVMKQRGVFVVPIGGAVRIALCSTAVADVPRLVEALVAGLVATGDAPEAGSGAAAAP